MKAKIFQTFRDLQDDLGRIDASFAYIALCLKFFECSAASSGNKSEFLKKQAEHHSVRVYLLDNADPQLDVFFSSVIAVNSEWDRFLYGIIDELQEFKYQRIDQGLKRDGESRLNFFLRKINEIAPGKLSDLPEILIDLCEYLRLLRNYYAHRATSPNKECVKVFEKIQKNTQGFPSKFGKLKLTSKCGKLCFDDVLILTIAVKLLAEEICNRLAPEPKLLLEHPDTLNFIDRQKLKKNRVSESSLELFFYDRFGLDRKTAQKLARYDNEALV
jgi:hypothetical protein